MCDCIDKVNKLLAESAKEQGYESAKLAVAHNFTNGLTYPEILYFSKKANIKKKYRGVFIPEFCPFCGVRYLPKETD